ncbi:MAG: HlyD family efflux transporter periplasmic adaptor subunit [Saprospiraceae bacterium]|nr:HlyD family efflux transporter periplasmic adaptor subunit [Saprospiraceae bacterium]
MKTSTRRIFLALPYLALLAAVALMIYFQNQKESPQVREEVETVREIAVSSVVNTPLHFRLNVQGELFAFDKVEIYSEVGGLMLESSNPFKEGVSFSNGSILARIDNEEAKLSLLSQKASLQNAITQIMPDLKLDYPASFPQWEAYLTNFNVEEPIQALPEPQNNQEKFFIASRNIHTQYYTIKSAESRLNKYRVYAPFNGVLTEALVQTGTVIRVGQKLGTFMRTGTYELEAKIPLTELSYLRVGDRLTLTSSEMGGSWEGRIKRIADQIDRSSQTVSVFIGVSGSDLREGMYLQGELKTARTSEAVVIHQELLLNGNSIFRIVNGVLESTPVEVVRIEGDQAFIQGLPDGSLIPDRIIPGAYNGLKVKPIEVKPTSVTEN